MGKDQDIIQAVKDNDFIILQKLLQKATKLTKNKIMGSNKKLNVNFQDTDGMSALHQAALMSSAQMLRTLLDSGASPSLKDNKGMTALHYASWQGVSQPVQILLHSGSPVNEQSLSGETPLHLAAQHGHYDVTTLLLNQHADPTIYNKDLRTSLDLACEFGRNRVVELLLRSNLCQKLLEDSPTDSLDNSRTTCLHLAAKNGHAEIIKLLLQAGMNINRSTLKGTCLHEAAMAGKIDVVRLLLDCGVDVNKPNSYDQTALDIVHKFANGLSGKELKDLLKEASCAVYARATKDYSNAYDPGSLAFKEGNIITVLEQRTDGIWRGYVYHEGRMAKIGMFPANHVVLIDSKVVARQQQQHQQQQQQKTVQMYGQVPDLLNRGPSYGSSLGTVNHYYSASDRGSLESSSTDDSQPITSHSFPSTPSSNFPPPPSSMLSSYSQRGPLIRDPSNADSGFSSSQSLPQYTPSSPAAPQQFGKPAFTFCQALNSNDNIIQSNNGNILDYHHHHHQQHNGEWLPAPTSLPVLGGLGGDMRGSSPAKDSPGHSNRNSAASSDSGRGCSTGHSEVKPVHSYVNVHVNNQQHRLSGQSYESGVSSRQSYHSSSSSSLGSLDRLEESGFTSTINVAQLLQAGVPDNEVLHAWLHDLHFEDYFPLFIQAGYDMPTVSRMTPEDLTAIGITKPAHRKRLKSEIARLNINDGIPDFRPNDLMEWLHLLGLGIYLDTLCGQGYDSIDYVTDITWEDLEEIGIQKLGHQKKIMLAIDRLKRITCGVKHISSVDGRTASLELLEPPPPAPPITGRWSGGEITAVPPHVYDGVMLGAKPKKSPSGDSISTTSSGHSGSSAGSGDIRVIPLPREDVGLAGAIPYRHNSTGSASGLQLDLVAMQGKKVVMKSSLSEDRKDMTGPPVMYQSCHSSSRRLSDNDVFLDNPRSFDGEGNSIYSVASAIMMDKHRPVARVMAKSQTEKHEHENNADGNKIVSNAYPLKGYLNNNNNTVGMQIGEHIYDTPQLSPSHKSLKPSLMVKPASPFESMAGHVNSADMSKTGQSAPHGAGGKGGKKIPPPPPIRTHSIRGESSSDSAPSSPSKVNTAPTTITVSASVHPQPTAIIVSKQMPPPVMQKPQKHMPSAVITKLQGPNNQQLPQNPPIALKPQSPKPVQSQKISIAPSVHPFQHSIVSGHGTQQPQVFNSPVVALQHQTQPKSPLPIKSPQAPIVAISPQQQHLPHNETLSPNRLNNTGSTLLSAHLQPKSKAIVLPSQHIGPNSAPQPSHQQPPQVQALASCMKNLSEKVGKRAQDDDQFPDNVSTDSDEFPPPPPPIAMDIITPKIHNYGIPSPRDRGKPEYGLQHQREYTQKSHSNTTPTRNFVAPTGIQQDHSQKNLGKPQGQNIESKATVGPTKTLPEHISGVQLRKQLQMSSTSSSPSNSDHEHTPEPEQMNTISNEKRSDSTTSFESSSSTSSIDSNTLPFANENVGTIKQKTANVKPSIVQSVNMEDGLKSVNLNHNLFENEAHRITAGYSNSSSKYLSQSPFSHHTNSEAAKTSMYSSDSHQQKHLHQLPNSSTVNSSGPIQPLQSNKDATSNLKSSKQSAEVSSRPPDSQKQIVLPAGKQTDAGNVLNDIDDMLQDLTDELDAMLEEEMAS